jgi:hypothetical protein
VWFRRKAATTLNIQEVTDTAADTQHTLTGRLTDGVIRGAMATVGITIMMTGVMDGVMAVDGVMRSMVDSLEAVVVDGVMVAAGTHSRTKATAADTIAADPTYRASNFTDTIV